MLKKFADDRDQLIERLLAGQITNDNVGDKNFKLGQLEIVNYLLSENLFDDLGAEIGGSRNEK